MQVSKSIPVRNRSVDSNLKVRYPIPRKLALSTREGLHLVSWQQVVRCEADNNYTTVFLNDGSKLFVSKTLGRIQEVLPSLHFVRVHQSHLVNLNSIRFAGHDDVVLEDNVTVPIGQIGNEIIKLKHEVKV